MRTKTKSQPISSQPKNATKNRIRAISPCTFDDVRIHAHKTEIFNPAITSQRVESGTSCSCMPTAAGKLPIARLFVLRCYAIIVKVNTDLLFGMSHAGIVQFPVITTVNRCKHLFFYNSHKNNTEFLLVVAPDIAFY